MRAEPLAFALLLTAIACERPPDLPVIGKVPDFALTDQTGAPFRGSALDGKVAVVDFIFTRCVTACPMLTAQMANFRRRLGDRAREVQFVSISVDPGYDTPEVLARYAQSHGADAGWRFLTGDATAINRVVVQGFKVAMGARTADQDGEFDILHAQHFVLLDRQRQIRGYYRTDTQGLAELERGIDALLGR